MHVTASAELLGCEDLVPADCESIEVDISVAELFEAGGYGYIALLAYDVEEITSVEFVVEGWPTGRGAPTLNGPYWCPDDPHTYGDHLDEGGATAFESCVQPDSNGIALLGYFYFGPLDSSDVPIELGFIPSTYTEPEDSILAVTDCSADYVVDEVIAQSGGTIGGVYSRTELDCSSSEGGPGDQEGEPGGGDNLATGGASTWDPPPAGDPAREIIARFRPGIIELPTAKVGAPTDSVLVNSAAVAGILDRGSAEWISKAYPGFQLEDTLRIMPDGRSVKLTDYSQVYKVRFPTSEGVELLARDLDSLPSVIQAERNACIRLDGRSYAPRYPGDEHFGKQWGLHNTGQAGGTADMDIDGPEAWGITTGSSQVIIGIVDDGVDFMHDDLQGKMSGDDWFYGSHGTWVAGIAGAWTDNDGIGIAGVDWNAQMVSAYTGPLCDVPCLVSAIHRAMDWGAIILNNSWNLVDQSGYPVSSEQLRTAFADAYKQNRVAVASMGNDEWGQPQYPAAFGQGILAVGAFDNQGRRSRWSNWGSHIDVLAPGGSNIGVTTDEKDVYSTWPMDTYRYAGGTSGAAAHASGVAGLLKAYREDLDNDDIEQLIRISAVEVDPPGFDVWTGMGRMNASEALKLARFPSLFYHHTAKGGTTYTAEEVPSMRFISTQELDDGFYYAIRYGVRRSVQFPFDFMKYPHVWGRGVDCHGYSDADTCFGMGWCGVLGDPTYYGCYLHTFVYEVWDYNTRDYVGWIPCRPESVEYAYSVLLEGSLFWDDCGDPLNEPHLVHGDDSTCAGDEPLEVRTQSVDPSYVLYRYDNLDPLALYRVTVCYYDCFDALDVCQSLWADHQELHGGFCAPGTPVVMGPYVVDPSVYHFDFEFDLAFDAEYTPPWATAAVAWILVEEAFYLGVEDEGRTPSQELTRSFEIVQNLPNPFNPATEIRYTVAHACHVTLEIYNVLGQRVTTLVDGRQDAGRKSVVWVAESSPSGVYFCRLKAGDFEAMKKMLLVR